VRELRDGVWCPRVVIARTLWPVALLATACAAPPVTPPVAPAPVEEAPLAAPADELPEVVEASWHSQNGFCCFCPPGPPPPQVVVRRGVGTVTGPLDRREVDLGLARAQDRLAACYTRAMHTQPIADVEVRFVVARSGSVSAAAVAPDEGELGACVKDELLRMRVEPPRSGMVTASYPLSFRLEEPFTAGERR
jgi:hypothetical protein